MKEISVDFSPIFLFYSDLFSAFRGLRVFAEPKQEKFGYVYDGCASAVDLKNYCQENDVSFGFSVHIGIVDYEDLYEYSSSFGDYVDCF